MARAPDGFVQLTVTSPPYDDMRDYNGYKFEFEKIAQELFRVTQIGGTVVWVVADKTENFCESLSSSKQKIFFVEQCGFNILDTMIYKKNGNPSQFPGMMRYQSAFEYMMILCKEKPLTFNKIRDRKNLYAGKKITSATYRKKNGTLQDVRNSPTISNFGDRNNVWEYDVGFLKSTPDEVAYEHPGIFPENLARDHIYSWSNKGDLVYDPFMGSGTTAKMCILMDRNYIGSEISKEYCELAEKRIRPYRMQTKLDLG